MSNVLDNLGRIKVTAGGSGSGGNVWPLPGKLNIGATEYSTLTAALAALGAGDNLMTGEGTYTINSGSITTAGELSGSGRNATFLQNASATSYVLRINLSGNYAISNLTLNPPATTIDALNLNNAGLNLQLTNVNIFVDSDTAVGLGEGITKCINLLTGATLKLFNCWLVATGVIGSGRTWHALYVQAGTTIVNSACILDGPLFAAASSAIILDGCTWLNAQPNAGSGTLTGHYYDASGNHITLDTTGKTSGVWQIDESALLKIKRATLATAIAAAASGDTIKLDTDTYSVAASQNIGVSLTIEGDGPEATIYTTSVSNDTCFDITADSITVVFRNLTIRHTGGGTAATGIFSNNAGVTVILDNCVLEISSGAPTTGRGLWIESGTWILRNGAKVVVTSGTSKYGIYNDVGAATVTIGPGCEVGGATQDVYGDQAGSTLKVNSPIFTNSLISWAGTITDQSQVSRLVQSDFGAVALSADATGYLSSVVQPLFSAFLSATASDVTGDGTFYQVINDTEIFDVNSNYNNSTGVFTAPKTAKYLFTFAVYLTQLAAAHNNFQVRLATSNRTYVPFNFLFGAGANPVQETILPAAIIADMDVGDTAFVQAFASGSTKVVDVGGNASVPLTYLQGYMLI